ncbi:MAG: hypothetical protein MJZ81_07370 [Bacteroidales bacterium]|nr:hypothetical protein [Bacteroidales bacterium]
MSVQHSVIKRGSFNPNDVVPTETAGVKSDKSVTGGQGGLATGVPGNLLDDTPHRVATGIVEAGPVAAGEYVEGKGVVVNPREYAMAGIGGDPLKPTLVLSSGDAASFCTFGHVVMANKDVTALDGKMNYAVLEGFDPANGVGAKLYVRVTEEVETAFTAANWKAYDPSTVETFSEEKSYEPGDVFKNEDALYVCTEEVEAAPFDAESFVEIDTTPVPYASDAEVGTVCFIADDGICLVELSGFSAS